MGFTCILPLFAILSGVFNNANAYNTVCRTPQPAVDPDNNNVWELGGAFMQIYRNLRINCDAFVVSWAFRTSNISKSKFPTFAVWDELPSVEGNPTFSLVGSTQVKPDGLRSLGNDWYAYDLAEHGVFPVLSKRRQYLGVYYEELFSSTDFVTVSYQTPISDKAANYWSNSTIVADLGKTEILTTVLTTKHRELSIKPTQFTTEYRVPFLQAVLGKYKNRRVNQVARKQKKMKRRNIERLSAKLKSRPVRGPYINPFDRPDPELESLKPPVPNPDPPWNQAGSGKGYPLTTTTTTQRPTKPRPTIAWPPPLEPVIFKLQDGCMKNSENCSLNEVLGRAIKILMCGFPTTCNGLPTLPPIEYVDEDVFTTMISNELSFIPTTATTIKSTSIWSRTTAALEQGRNGYPRPGLSPVICPSPPAIDNGSPTKYGEGRKGEKVEYVCEPGFEMLGVNFTVCAEAGAWSEIPTCVKGPLACIQPAQVGNCKYSDRKWFYDLKTKSCLQFFYSGCGGNANQFDSESECALHCKTVFGRLKLSG